jgi:hypothetical protein
MTTTDDQTPMDTTEADSAPGVSCAAAAGSVIRPPNLVQIGDLWICEDEDQVMPDKIEFALLIQCSSAEQCRAAMKAGKIEFTIFEHYSQNDSSAGTGDTGPRLPGQ